MLIFASGKGIAIQMYSFITPTGKNLGEEKKESTSWHEKGKGTLTTEITNVKRIWGRLDSEREREKKNHKISIPVVGSKAKKKDELTDTRSIK